jgi:hypothetical protein
MSLENRQRAVSSVRPCSLLLDPRPLGHASAPPSVKPPNNLAEKILTFKSVLEGERKASLGGLFGRHHGAAYTNEDSRLA